MTVAMGSYAGSGVARSLYYYRKWKVLDYSMLRRLKTIRHNSTMETGSAAQQLIEELRFFIALCYFFIQVCVSSNNFVINDRSDTSLDFIAVYSATNQPPLSVSLLQRTGADEGVLEEPLAEQAARELHSTRSSMCIEGKMLLGHTLVSKFC